MREIIYGILPAEESTQMLEFSDLEIFWHTEATENLKIKTVRFRGKISDKNSYWLNQKFYKINEINLENAIVLDLSELSRINSMGLAILHTLIFRSNEENIEVVVGGMHPFIKKIFSLIGGIPAVKVFDSHDKAKKSLLCQYHL